MWISQNNDWIQFYHISLNVAKLSNSWNPPLQFSPTQLLLLLWIHGWQVFSYWANFVWDVEDVGRAFLTFFSSWGCRRWKGGLGSTVFPSLVFCCSWVDSALFTTQRPASTGFSVHRLEDNSAIRAEGSSLQCWLEGHSSDWESFSLLVSDYSIPIYKFFIALGPALPRLYLVSLVFFFFHLHNFLSRLHQSGLLLDVIYNHCTGSQPLSSQIDLPIFFFLRFLFSFFLSLHQSSLP